MNELVNRMVNAMRVISEDVSPLTVEYWEKDAQYYLVRFPWLTSTITELCNLAVECGFYIRFIAYSNDPNPTVLLDLPLPESNYYDRGADSTYRIASEVGLGHALRLARMMWLGKIKLGKNQRSYHHVWNATGNWHKLVKQIRENQ